MKSRGRSRVAEGITGTTSIRARCPRYGDVSFGVDDVVILVVSMPVGIYRLSCPSCRDPVVGSATAAVIELLLTSGVAQPHSRYPYESLRVADITESEVERFRSLLEIDDGSTSSSILEKKTGYTYLITACGRTNISGSGSERSRL